MSYLTTAMLFVSGQPTVAEDEAITSPGPGGRFARLPTMDAVGEGFAGAVYVGAFEYASEELLVGFCSRMPLDGRDVVLYLRGESSHRPTLRIFEHNTAPISITVTPVEGDPKVRAVVDRLYADEE